jgi:hypothetical protein
VVTRYWNEVYVEPAAVRELRDAGRLDSPRGRRVAVEDWGLDA